jgi:hypothetical protein
MSQRIGTLAPRPSPLEELEPVEVAQATRGVRRVRIPNVRGALQDDDGTPIQGSSTESADDAFEANLHKLGVRRMQARRGAGNVQRERVGDDDLSGRSVWSLTVRIPPRHSMTDDSRKSGLNAVLQQTAATLRTRSGGAQATMTSVKHFLVGSSGARLLKTIEAGPSASRETRRLLLPLLVLMETKPRTPQQLDVTLNRLAMMLRSRGA